MQVFKTSDKVKVSTFISVLLSLLIILGTTSPALANNVTNEELDNEVTEEVLIEETEEQESTEGTESEDTIEEPEAEGVDAAGEESTDDTVSDTTTIQGSSRSLGISTFGADDLALYNAAYAAATNKGTINSNSCKWYITADGQLVIYPTDGVSGTLADITATISTRPWYTYRATITSAYVAEGVIANTNLSYMFGHSSGTSVYPNLTFVDLSNLDTSRTTNMLSMFRGCNSLQSIIFSNKFDTSAVTSMYSMFFNCTALTTLDLSNFNTSAVTSMYCMFGNCSSLTTLDLSSFNTSAVTSMSYMFDGCSTLVKITLGLGFSFEGKGNARLTDLPIPSGLNPDGLEYTNLWEALSTGVVYAYNEIPNNVEETYIAQTFAETFVVTFVDWDGIALDTQTVEHGGSVVSPVAPTREGYTFIGWDTDFTRVLSNLTVTAQYEEIINISVTVPSEIPGYINGDGSITFPDNLEIVNESVVGIYISEVEAVEASDYTLVNSAGFATASAINSLQMDINELDIADYIGGSATPVGSFEMESIDSPTGDNKIKLVVDGWIKNIDTVPTSPEKAYQIIWTVAAGKNS